MATLPRQVSTTAKPKKGVVPPQLRKFLFKPGHSSAASSAAPKKAAKMVKKGKKKGHAAVPIIPTIVAVLPEILVGIKAAQDMKEGVSMQESGTRAILRLGRLYGAVAVNPNEPIYAVGTNVSAKAAAGIAHLVARKTGLRLRLSKRWTLL